MSNQASTTEPKRAAAAVDHCPKTISRHAYARVGLLGNPSDGYFGKVLGVTIQNFSVEVV